MGYLIILMSMLAISPSHVGHLAEYHYQFDGTQLRLRFFIETEQLMAFTLSKECDQEGMTALCTAKYLAENTAILLNGEKVDLQLQSSKTEFDHLIVYLTAEVKLDEIKELTIQNSCFYEFAPKFRNRVVVDIGDFNNSYMLTKGHEEIQLE